MSCLLDECLEEDIGGQDVDFEVALKRLKIIIVTQLCSDLFQVQAHLDQHTYDLVAHLKN